MVMNHFQPARRLVDQTSPSAYVQPALATVKGSADSDCRTVTCTGSAAVYSENVACRQHDVSRAAGMHAPLKVSYEHLLRAVCVGRRLEQRVSTSDVCRISEMVEVEQFVKVIDHGVSKLA
jgi:hypothetical protein